MYILTEIRTYVYIFLYNYTKSFILSSFRYELFTHYFIQVRKFEFTKILRHVPQLYIPVRRTL